MSVDCSQKQTSALSLSKCFVGRVDVYKSVVHGSNERVGVIAAVGAGSIDKVYDGDQRTAPVDTGELDSPKKK